MISIQFIQVKNLPPLGVSLLNLQEYSAKMTSQDAYNITI